MRGSADSGILRISGPYKEILIFSLKKKLASNTTKKVHNNDKGM